MPKYALVVTADERLLPGVHAMLNGIKYYGWPDDLEFHFLYWPGKNTEKFIADMQASGHYPNLVPVNLLAYRLKEGEVEQHYRPVYYLKFYRSLYAGRLTDYDAVGFMDADRAICGDISPYFPLAKQSGRICMVDHKYNQQRFDTGWYNEHPHMGTNGCPFDPSATFFDPKLYGEDFGKVRDYGKELGNSEMPNVNYMLTTHGYLDKVLRLPTARWNVRRWEQIETEWVNNRLDSGKWEMMIESIPGMQLGLLLWHVDHTDNRDISHIADQPDCRTMLSIHGRWWFRATLQKKPAKRDKLESSAREGYLRQNVNIANIWEVFKFFNFDCYTRLEPWMAEWGSYDEYIQPETGELLRREIVGNK